jgi:predicted ATP-grasp superfamily ATP-dependent carboligase
LNRECPVRISRKPGLSRSSLVVGWSIDAGRLGWGTAGYLNRKLEGQEFAEIDPECFFSLSGVAVKDDLALFPASKFCACPGHGLVVFASDYPEVEWDRFLNSVLDVTVQHCGMTELYIIGAMVSWSAHTSPRQLFAVVNSEQMKEALSGYDVVHDMDYQTPPGERPTLNAFLLWVAKMRNIPAVSLWVPIPFYLAGTGDPRAQRRVLGFLDQRLGLKLDFDDLDRRIGVQNQRLARARSDSSQIDEYIGRLESGLRLSNEENAELIRRIEDFVGQED